MLFVFILVIAFIIFAKTRFYDEKILTVYFGLPGAGKSTFAAHLAKECLKESFVVRFLRSHCDKYPIFNKWLEAGRIGIFNLRIATPVYSNVPIAGAYEIDANTDVGFYMIRDGKLIIDEAGIEYNNRAYKSMSKEIIKWFKLHRHYRMSVDVFSQSFEDMDITLRRLAYRYYLVQKSAIPNVILCRRIYRRVGVDPMTHQIVDQYDFGLPFFDTRRIWAPHYYKMFDSYDAPELPQKEWSTYTAAQVEDFQQYDPEVFVESSDPQEAAPDVETISFLELIKINMGNLFNRIKTIRRAPEDPEEDDQQSLFLEDINPDDINTPEEDKIFGYLQPLEEDPAITDPDEKYINVV